MEKLSICLACNLGSSTSILVNKMKQVADYQIIMLGPQIGHRRNEIEQKVASINIPVTVIDAADYGSMNAANILKEAIYQIKTAN